MATEEEVELFLRDFKAKLSVWNVLFLGREKNTQALIDLDISPSYRTEVLKKLGVKDYCEGPLLEQVYQGADMWVFGKMIGKEEVYIKITMGAPNRNVLCISFHIAEHPMKYYFKKTK